MAHVNSDVKVTINVKPSWHTGSTPIERVVRAAVVLTRHTPVAEVRLARTEFECTVYAPLDVTAGSLQKLADELRAVVEAVT